MKKQAPSHQFLPISIYLIILYILLIYTDSGFSEGSYLDSESGYSSDYDSINDEGDDYQSEEIDG